MKLFRILLTVTVVAALSGVALVGQATAPAGVVMADAATKFLASLPADLKVQATFPYDDKERVNWHFVPLQDKEKRPTRKGVRLENLNAEQKALALAMLKAGTSADGFAQATAIMELEGVLRELEKQGAMVRNPNWYFVSVFGTPSNTGPWGWRFEGHHLSLNFTLDKGEVVSATPSCFAANPAEVKSGAKQGQRVIAEVEDLAWEMVKSLTPEQRQVAIRDKHFPEIAQAPAADVGAPVGLPASKMTEPQKALLTKLIKAYTRRLAAPVEAKEYAVATKNGLDGVYFAYTGGTEPGTPHTYRVQGEKFVIEFLNVQADGSNNPANHIHSAWRRLPADFGLTNR